jgi:hypothetical protein
LIDGNIAAPIEFPANPPRFAFWPTLTGLTPGESVINWVKLRPFEGRSLIDRSVTIVPNSAVEESTGDTRPVTVIVSDEEPGTSRKSTVDVWLTCRTNPALMLAAKPAFETIRAYCPGRISRIEKVPDELVLVRRLAPVAEFVRDT